MSRSAGQERRLLLKLGYFRASGYSGPAHCEECGRPCGGLLGWYLQDRSDHRLFVCHCRECAIAAIPRQRTLFDREKTGAPTADQLEERFIDRIMQSLGAAS